MLILATAFLLVAAAIHLYIFGLESLWWDTDRTRATFGIASQSESKATAAMAFNQGFYNLFLAIGLATGLGLLLSGQPIAGTALCILAAGSMVGAGVVLLAKDHTKTRAALIQLTPPALGLLCLLLSR